MAMVTAGEHLWTFECKPECGFLVRDLDRRELVVLAVQHEYRTHRRNVAPTDVEKVLHRGAPGPGGVLLER